MDKKFKIGDLLIGRDNLHWKVADGNYLRSLETYYALWNVKRRYTKVLLVEFVEDNFKLDITTIRRKKLEKINSSCI